jgi:catechol 2,3-dioxygenase-like lactoylglutathione lyase family enzyme
MRRLLSRRLIGGALLTALVVTIAPASRTGAAPVQALASSVDAVGLTVRDMDRSVAFFTGVLSFEPVSDIQRSGDAVDRVHGVFGARTRVVRLRLGQEQIELTEYLTPRGRPVPAGSQSNDRWFQHVAIIVSDMDRAYTRLRQQGVEPISPAPQRLPDWNPAAGGIEAFYFKDPDGHPLEVLKFPPGKGDARWQDASGRLFLGIDHTAIVVADTAASLAFYRDILGLRVAGESTNYGPEQERLNNVPGARLHITGLRAASGPGVEFLEYLTPRNGRPADGIQANDVGHWETTVTTPEGRMAFDRLLRAKVFLVSPDVAMLPAPGTAQRAFLVRDPDGHAVKVIER